MKSTSSKLLGILLAGMVSIPVFAQRGYPVKGAVLDAEGPVVGATILEAGTQNGVSTGSEGEFALTVSSADALVEISCIGYAPVSYKAGLLPKMIVLEPDSQFLDEVVVIGYGEVRKTDATGSVVAMRPDELNRVKATTTEDLLLGKIAGLQITQGSGSAGSTGTIRIRQGASLNASNEPLIIVDGMVGESIHSVNTDDIESINVLKDASSAAIYGARGANGVIIITTKKGPQAKGGKTIAPRVSYRGDYTLNYAYQKLDVYDPDEFRAEYIRRGWDAELLGNASSDWQKAVTQTALNHRHTLSVRGALPHLPYRVSVGYQDNRGAVKGNLQRVATASVQLNPSFLQDHLNFNIGLRENYKKSPASGGSITDAALTDPTRPIYTDYGKATVNGVEYDQKAFGFTMYGADASGNSPITTNNEVADALYPGLGYSENNRVSTNLSAIYKVHGLEDLTATVSFNGHYYTSYTKDLGRDNTPSTWSSSMVALGKGGQGKNSYSTSSSYHYNVDYYLNYKHVFAGIHGVDATLGHSYEDDFGKSFSSASYYNDGDLVENSLDSESQSELRLSSWFGRLNYILLDRYLFTFTMRADASSRFAPETRWGYFPSAAVAWKMDKEPFIKRLGFVDELKLRASYGKTGQQDIGTRYAYQASYYVSDEFHSYLDNGTWYPAYRPTAFDRTIQWEVTTTKNIGLDFGFFKNRFSGSVEYYDRWTDNLLMNSVMIPAGSNFSNSLDQNIGQMSSRGVEAALTVVPVNTRNTYWTISANFAWNTARIESLTSYEDPDAYITIGNSSRYMRAHKVGHKPYTYFLAKQAYDESGKALEKWYNPAYDPNDPDSPEFIEDTTSDSSRWMKDEDRSGLVPYYGGLSSSFRHRNWDLGLNAHYGFGQYVFWQTVYGGCDNSFFSQYHSYPTNTFKSIVPDWGVEHYETDYWLFKGDYFKLDNIVAGYTFDKTRWFNSCRVAVGLQNVFTITKYPGLDPEVYGGMDSTSTPRPRMVMFSLNVEF